MPLPGWARSARDSTSCPFAFGPESLDPEQRECRYVDLEARRSLDKRPDFVRYSRGRHAYHLRSQQTYQSTPLGGMGSSDLKTL